jgi:hypothetical protein
MMRVTRVGSGRARLDLLTLQEAPNPVETRTWGRIKALFAGF